MSPPFNGNVYLHSEFKQNVQSFLLQMMKTREIELRQRLGATYQAQNTKWINSQPARQTTQSSKACTALKTK
jgi:hypothetical protein